MKATIRYDSFFDNTWIAEIDSSQTVYLCHNGVLGFFGELAQRARRITVSIRTKNPKQKGYKPLKIGRRGIYYEDDKSPRLMGVSLMDFRTKRDYIQLGQN